MGKFNAARGMSDLFSEDLIYWEKIESLAKKMFSSYGFTEIRTPLLEDLNLFRRSVGETTDIIEKEMYIFSETNHNDLCLRPENTAGVVRAVIESNILKRNSDFKCYYIGPMFRKERPQKGRLRQFHQLGAEFFGASSYLADVEVISLLFGFLSHLGLNGLRVIINSIGDSTERGNYISALRSYFSKFKNELCSDCERRFFLNVLRIMDCKNAKCAKLKLSAPKCLDFLKQDSMLRFEKVIEKINNLNISYAVDSKLIRGLDYYSGIVFEVVSESGLGSQNAIAAGGRYDELMRNLGGDDAPAVGFAAGIERIVLMLKNQETKYVKVGPDITFIYSNDNGLSVASDYVSRFRSMFLYADIDLSSKSIRSQMRRANKLNSKCVAILGEREITQKKTIFKNLKSGLEQEINLDFGSIKTALINSGISVGTCTGRDFNF